MTLKINNILFITAIIYLLGKSQAVEVLKKSKEFPDRQLFFSDYSFKDALLVYAVCENQTLESERQCIIYQEVSPYENVTRSCNVTLKSEYKDGKVSDLFVAAFNPDTAIISWLEEGSTILDHIGTFNLNKCMLSTRYFVDDENNSPIAFWQFKNARTIVMYKTVFDVFFKFLSCGDKECKVSINSEGQFINGPTEAMDRLPHYISKISSIDSASPDKGYVYKKLNGKDASYIVQKPDGSEKILTTSPENMLDDIVSTSNGKINIYFKTLGPNGTKTLLQYDADGNNLLTTDLPEVNESLQVVTIYNLPEGGSLLLLSDLGELTSGCSKMKGFTLIKIDAAGKKLGELQLQGINDKTYDIPTDRHWRHIWRSKQGGYCATIVGPTSTCSGGLIETQNDLQVIENCFTDADFSK